MKIEAAKALSSSKKKATVVSLLDAAKYLDTAVMGGTEVTGLRKKANEVFDQSLAKITGVVIDKKWSKEEKAKAFMDATKDLPD